MTKKRRIRDENDKYERKRMENMTMIVINNECDNISDKRWTDSITTEVTRV